MKNIVFLLCCIGIHNLLSSQEASKLQNAVHIQLGANHYRVVDQAFTQSNLKLTGTPFALRLAYQRNTDRSLLNVLANLSIGKISTNSFPIATKLYHWKLALSCARPALTYDLLGTTSTFYAGGQLSMFNYVITDREIFENGTVTFSNTANLYFHQNTVLSPKSMLTLAVELPLLGLVRRESYDDGANPELRDASTQELLFSDHSFSFINPLTLCRFTMGYSLAIGNHLETLLHYHFNYLSNTDIQSIRLYANGISAGIKANF